AHVELAGNLIKAISICSPKKRKQGGPASGLEPNRLIVGRGDRKLQSVAGLVPHAAVVRGKNTEPVSARRKIGILNLPLIDYLSPVAVLAFEFVSKANLLRGCQAISRVMDRDIADRCRQPQSLTRVVRTCVRLDLLNPHRRWNSVEDEMTRVENTHA